MGHHAYFIAAPVEEGIEQAERFVEKEMQMKVKANPDVVTFRYGLFSVEDARQVLEFAYQAPIAGDRKAIIIAASRAYHEAQNALLKLFEEPPEDTTIFLILPAAGMLLSTLRSRVALLATRDSRAEIPESARAFLSASLEKRTALIKKLTAGRDEDARREGRDEALLILEGVERAVHDQWLKKENAELAHLLSDIATLRSYLYDRSASLRMILEHISLVLPNRLL